MSIGYLIRVTQRKNIKTYFNTDKLILIEDAVLIGEKEGCIIYLQDKRIHVTESAETVVTRIAQVIHGDETISVA